MPTSRTLLGDKARELSTEEVVRLQALFDKVDDDGSRTITKNEFRVLIHALLPSATDSELLSNFLAADSDGSDSIDFSEFVGFFARLQGVDVSISDAEERIDDTLSSTRTRREKARSAWFSAADGLEALERRNSESPSRREPASRRQSRAPPGSPTSRRPSRAPSAVPSARSPSPSRRPSAEPEAASSGPTLAAAAVAAGTCALLAAAAEGRGEPDGSAQREAAAASAAAADAAQSAAPELLERKLRVLALAEAARRGELEEAERAAFSAIRRGCYSRRSSLADARRRVALELEFECMRESERRNVLCQKETQDRRRLRFLLWELETAGGAKGRPTSLRWQVEVNEAVGRRRAVQREALPRAELLHRAEIAAAEAAQRRATGSIAALGVRWGAPAAPAPRRTRVTARWGGDSPGVPSSAPRACRPLGAAGSPFLSADECVWQALGRAHSSPRSCRSPTAVLPPTCSPPACWPPRLRSPSPPPAASAASWLGATSSPPSPGRTAPREVPPPPLWARAAAEPPRGSAAAWEARSVGFPRRPGSSATPCSLLSGGSSGHGLFSTP
eukprot:TRINITY_DN29353_c0_g1_i1.p2 TRINITY_DN29353_c0_g1~~TRINITY_DN29353_c0_g1_i1.p2  ORF type:complete len:584 (+),score=118.83 TRINITY_DN29353_c0_g1_i1:68-1753(+)